MTVDEPVNTSKPRERPSSRCPGSLPHGEKITKGTARAYKM